jgi:hypothetical protein
LNILKRIPPQIEAPSCSHGFQDSTNTREIKLSQRLLPDPLGHHFALKRIQEGSESVGALAMDENKRETEGMSDVRMDLPAHEEATM